MYLAAKGSEREMEDVRTGRLCVRGGKRRIILGLLGFSLSKSRYRVVIAGLMYDSVATLLSPLDTARYYARLLDRGDWRLWAPKRGEGGSLVVGGCVASFYFSFSFALGWRGCMGARYDAGVHRRLSSHGVRVCCVYAAARIELHRMVTSPPTVLPPPPPTVFSFSIDSLIPKKRPF